MQEVPEGRQVQILIGALGGEPKREIEVIDVGKRDKVSKVFEYLDSLYQRETPLPVLRSQFYGCRQRSGEPFNLFVLCLKKLYCKLQRRDPTETSSEELLKEQLFLGMEDGPLARHCSNPTNTQPPLNA